MGVGEGACCDGDNRGSVKHNALWIKAPSSSFVDVGNVVWERRADAAAPSRPPPPQLGIRCWKTSFFHIMCLCF